VLIAYGAKDGTVASDGRGRNSPFTAALLNNLEKAGVEIRFLLASVRDEVLAATSRQQQPFVYGSLSRQAIYLKPPAQPENANASAALSGLQQPLTEAERAWAVVQANPGIAALEAFVRRFPDSFYADLARGRIDELKKNAVVLPDAGTAPPAAVAPPPLRDRLAARLAELSVAVNEAEARARDYESARDHKAIAVSPRAHRSWRTSGITTDDAAVTATLEKCQVYYGEPCILAAVGDKLEQPSGSAPAVRDMPRARYDGLFDAEQIPGTNGTLKRRNDVASYRSVAGPKAAAYHPLGRLFTFRGSGQFEAEELALRQCNDDPDRNGLDGPCFLYAVGDQVVLPQRSFKPLTPRAEPAQTQQAAVKPQTNSPQASLRDLLLPKITSLGVAASEAEAVARGYEAGRDSKSIAVAVNAHHTWRTSGRSSQEAANNTTLEGCQIQYGEPCTLVAAGDNVAPLPARDMPRTRYSGRFDPERLPSTDGDLLKRTDVTGYRSMSGPKAAAYHPWGHGWLFIVTGAPGQFEAEEQALAQCNDDPRRKAERQEGPCFLYAAGDYVVLPRRLTKPRPRPETIREALDYVNAPGFSSPYPNDKEHKAIALALESGQTFRWTGQPSATLAEQKALEACQLTYRTPCILLASDDELRAPDPWKAARRDMPRLNYKGKYAPDRVPLFSGTEDRLRTYAGLPAPRAMAIRPNGSRVNIATGISPLEAQVKALAACNDDLDPRPCFVYAVNDRVVLDQRRTEPLK
jgi:hypothetical protein